MESETRIRIEIEGGKLTAEACGNQSFVERFLAEYFPKLQDGMRAVQGMPATDPLVQEQNLPSNGGKAKTRTRRPAAKSSASTDGGNGRQPVHFSEDDIRGLGDFYSQHQCKKAPETLFWITYFISERMGHKDVSVADVQEAYDTLVSLGAVKKSIEKIKSSLSDVTRTERKMGWIEHVSKGVYRVNNRGRIYAAGWQGPEQGDGDVG